MKIVGMDLGKGKSAWAMLDTRTGEVARGQVYLNADALRKLLTRIGPDQLVIESAAGESATEYPGASSAIFSGFRRQHWYLLAQRLGILASDGNDDAVAELARAIGESVIGDDVPRMVVRVRRLRPSELNSDIDYTIDDPATYVPLYSADVFADSQGAVRIHKKIESDEAAPVVAN